MKTRARMILKDAPVMWRRINSIGVILDCNSTYAAALRHPKRDIIGRSVFEHVPKESWQAMNDSLTEWFETGRVADQRITFLRGDGTTFPGLLHATSIYDDQGNLLGSNTVILDRDRLGGPDAAAYRSFFEGAGRELEAIRREEYDSMDDESRAEYDGLEKMFKMMRSAGLEPGKRP